MPQTTDYLDPHTLASIASLDLRARMIVEGVMTGMHRSPYQGFSVEFAQHRQYVAGDDLRHLDWKIFARTDKLYLKQYQQETNLDLVLLVDASGSMAYTSQSAWVKPTSLAKQATWRKFDHAASLAAAMAYLALGQQDRVGLMLYADHLRVATRLSNTRDHWRGVAEALGHASLQVQLEEAQEAQQDHQPQAREGTQAEERGGVGVVFDELLAKLQRRSVIVWVSDLLEDAQQLTDSMARVHHRGHDMMILQPLDTAERTFPFRGPSEFVGLEGQGRLPLDPEALRQLYLQAFASHQAHLQASARRFGFDLLTLDTSESLGPPLSHFLAKREATMSRSS